MGKKLGFGDNYLQGLLEAKATHEDAIRSLMTVWLDKKGVGKVVPSRELLKKVLEEMEEVEVAQLF